MAAKVVMLAVPTVLGIASIRVYTVSDAPTEGLLTPEKLNFYTPVPRPARAQFVPERPGLIEGGFASAREGILPFAKAVQVACVSVKVGSVNLYHTGQDVYYYLKDPPPGFLPRFGTITMAGLLGMFLARKGSKFKRIAVPLGLMSAGASVCYPAQTVAVIKVTGRKFYAAGKWSSAAVSSLMTSRPQEPAAKDATASQAQSVATSSPESAQVSSAMPERQVETTESDPVPDEPSAAVITEEESSATLAEISPDPAPAEIGTEAEPAPPAEEPPANVESKEPSDTNGAGSAEHAAGAEPEMTAAPAVASPAEAESAPSSEAPPAPQASDEPAGVESAAQTEAADPPPVAASDETPTLTPPPPPPPPAQPAAENSEGGSDFKADRALMDFGQSSPEDEDLYSTRS